MAIRIKHRDPKSTDFSSTDIIININEGTLFYKTPTGLFKLQGDNLNTTTVEGGGGGGGSGLLQSVTDTTGQTGIDFTLNGSGDLSATISGLTTTSDVTFNNITSTGNTILGDASTDTHTFIGHITSSNNISSSGDIIINNITSSGNISGSLNSSFTATTGSFNVMTKETSILNFHFNFNDNNDEQFISLNGIYEDDSPEYDHFFVPPYSGKVKRNPNIRISEK